MDPSVARTMRVMSRFGCDWWQTAQVRVGTWSGRRFGIGRCLLRLVRFCVLGVISAGGCGGNAGLTSDVDAPAGQLGRQPRILPLLADGEAELTLGDDDVGDLVLLVDAH